MKKEFWQFEGDKKKRGKQKKLAWFWKMSKLIKVKVLLLPIQESKAY